MRNLIRSSMWTPALLLCVILQSILFSGCSNVPTDTPETRQAVIDAHNSLIDAYQAGDTEALISLLDPSNDLLIFHAMTEARFESIAEVRSGLPRMFAKLKGATWAEAHPKLIMRGNVACMTAHVSIEAPSMAQSFIGRGTEIWVKNGGNWQLVHGHWSDNPAL